MTARGRPALPAMLLAGALVAGAPTAAATTQTPAQTSTPASASPQAALDSKLRLVALLLAKSPAVQRIPQSNNVQARKKLADAQALYANATAEAAAGRTGPAIAMLDRALREIVEASRLVPDAAQLAAQERTRYAGLHESVRTFLGLQKNLAARSGQQPSGFDAGRVSGMLEKAEALAAGGNHKQANAVLHEAYQSVVSAINRMLMAETIVYGQKFDTPAEEFSNELARNRSYEDLIPIALAQLATSRDTALLSERYVQRSRELRAIAQKQAAGGDHAAALITIQEATAQLQRSLRVAGVIVPQAPEK